MTQQEIVLAIADQDRHQNGGPQYRLVKADILKLSVDAIVVSTDLYMQDDFMERLSSGRPSRRTRRWINTTDDANGLSITRIFNEEMYPAGLFWQTCCETPGGANRNHEMVLMANVAEKLDPAPAPPLPNGSNVTLRDIHTDILDRAMLMPPIADPFMDWRHQPASIAFPLLGCTLGHTYPNSADQALRAITDWFNHPGYGALRRAAIQRVDLVCPTRHQPGKDRIEHAWRRAWDGHISTAGIPSILGGKKVPEADRLRDEANRFIGGYNPGTGAVDPRLGINKNDYVVAPGQAIASVQTRIYNRVLRPKAGRTRNIRL